MSNGNLVIIVAMLVLLSSDGFGYVCRFIPPAEALKRAKAVFSGKIVDVWEIAVRYLLRDPRPFNLELEPGVSHAR